jgi:multicomponent K+:H+ antiporter subunit D
MVGPAHLVIAPILIPLVAAALMLLFEDRERRLKKTISLVSILALISVATALLRRVHVDNHATGLVYLVGNWPAPIAINLVADRLAVVMLLLTALLALPAMIFASQRWEQMGPHFHSLFQFLLVGLNGAFLTGDLFNLFVFFEVMLAASYGLVLHGGGALRVRAGMNYIVVNLVASLIFLIGIAMVFSAAGSLNMAEIALRAETMRGFAVPALHVGLAMLGLAFLIKAGMWPLGLWLVPAYSAAAGPVAAISAVLSKVGVYSLLRLALLVPNDGIAFGSLVIFIGGVVTLVFASVGVLASQSMKRASAYFLLMSSGTLLAAFGMSQPQVTAGALFYMLSSTLAIGAFFLVIELIEREQDAASSVLAVTMEAYGEGEEAPEEEAEVGRIMPGAVAVLGIGFCLLGMVLIGLPPLPGFIAKFAILTALLGPEASVPAASNGMRGLLALLLILSGVVSLLALSRSGIRAFWAPVEPFLPRVTVTETAPILYLLGLLVALMLAAGPTMELLLATADDLHNQVRYLNAVLGAERVTPFAGAHR